MTEVQSLLGLNNKVRVVHRSNDRPNIALVVREMLYSVRSLHDIAFLAPLKLDYSTRSPRKFMLFMQSKSLCEKAALFLRARIPPELIHKIVWVHSDMSRDHNQNALARLRTGEIFGIVCTDVAGMVGLA
jgi:superfamily II DNA/RNA helicase